MPRSKVKLEGAETEGGSFSVFCFGNQRMEGVWPYHQQQIDDVMYFTLFIIRFRVLRVNYFE